MNLKTSCCSCFESLSSDIRVKIVNLLQKKGRLSVSGIVSEFKLTQPTITHHLRDLENNGLVGTEKIGRQVFYSLKDKCKGGCDVLN